LSWGPFQEDLAPAERIARLRAVRALALVFARYDPAVHFMLKKAEAEAQAEALADREWDKISHIGIGALGRAEAAIDALPTIGKRRLLATYADLAKNTVKTR
jgi:hypothetical protein